MFKGFFWKIWRLGVFYSILAISLALFGLATYFLQWEKNETLKREYLLTQVISHDIESGYLKGIWPYKTFKMVSDDEDVLFLWVVKPDGAVFWADDSEMMGKIIEDPFLGQEELKTRDSVFHNEKIKFIASPIKLGLNEKPWTIILGISFKPLKKAQRDTIFLSIGFLILIAILISFVSYYFSRTLTRPLELLRKGAEIIGKGNLDHKIELKTNDEIEELSKTFNGMTRHLKDYQLAVQESKNVLEVKVQARTRELSELAKSLDEKVKQRTKELEKQINELEKFYRLTVGRELKMVELKKEIKEIKKNEKGR